MTVRREYAASVNLCVRALRRRGYCPTSWHSLRFRLRTRRTGVECRPFPRPSSMRPISLRTACVALLLSVVGVAAAAQGVFSGSGPWLDDTNRPFRLESLRGSANIVSMAYGACRRVCSSSLRVLEQLQALADARGEALNFVVIGLDPQQDRPADWAAYRTEHKLRRANWQFLSGDAKSTAQIAARLGVRYWSYGDHVMHDFRIVRVSADGRIVGALTSPDQALATLLP
ncbi:MAG: SCO family protein [Burkholderiaceae bacterium]